MVDWKSMTPQEVLAALESAPKVAVQRSSGWVAYSVGSFMVGFTHDEPIGKEEYLQQSGFLTIAAPQVEGPPMVHYLHEGRSLCEMSDVYGAPSDWPEGHKWVRLNDRGTTATCQGCILRRPMYR